MDPRHLFFDSRLRTDACVYCGGPSESRDHCPSKVLLDEPFPSELAVVDACKSCNEAFSADEQYVACLIECVISGSAELDNVRRPKIRRILAENPRLAARINESGQKDLFGNVLWKAEAERVKNVIVKLARGHFAYEFNVPAAREPRRVHFAPLVSLTESQRSQFQIPSESNRFAPWPEIGTRAFLRAAGAMPTTYSNGWIVVQQDRYRYRADDPGRIGMVLSEYLACSVEWDDE